MEIVKEDAVYNDMRKFIEEVELYLKTQTDDVEMGLNKLLQVVKLIAFLYAFYLFFYL